jgi:DNA-directed RNA polymerase subunit beta
MVFVFFRMADRINFAKLDEVISPPGFYRKSNQFLEGIFTERPCGWESKNVGVQSGFRDFFPVESYDGKCRLESVSYRICEPRHSKDYYICNGTTYADSLYITLRLCKEDKMGEEEIRFGEFPRMCKGGSFVVNGAERVVVSQLCRSPGICFEEIVHTSGKPLYAFRIIPDRGPWLEAQFDPNGLLYVYLDCRCRSRKFLLTTLLPAFGNISDQDILSLFYRLENKKVSSFRTDASLASFILIDAVVAAKEGTIFVRAHESLSKGLL